MISIKKLNRYLYIMMFLSIYLVSYYIRQRALGTLADINFLFIGCMIIYLCINRKKIDLKIVMAISIILIYIVINDKIGNSDPIKAIVRNIGMYIIPIYLLSVEIDENEIEGIFSSILKIVNFFTIIIFLIGIIDPLIGFKIMRFMGNYIVVGIRNLIYENTILPGYRYTSYMGHALFTKELFLYFYFLNIIYFKKFKTYKINLNIVSIVALIGVLLTGSKTGAVIILIAILFTNYKKNKYTNFFLGIGMIILAYIFGAFDTLILRLQTETLTTGRTKAGDLLKALGIMKIKIFSGYGAYAIRIIDGALGPVNGTAATEYPFKILLFQYGILCTVAIYGMIFIMPIVKFIKRKEYYIVFAVILKFADINTYNGLIFKPDNMILFILFISILLGASKYKKGGDSNLQNIDSNSNI